MDLKWTRHKHANAVQQWRAEISDKRTLRINAWHRVSGDVYFVLSEIRSDAMRRGTLRDLGLFATLAESMKAAQAHMESL